MSGQNDGSIEGQKMSGESAAEPALLIDLILPRLEQFCFLGKVCQFLREDSDFRRLEFRCHQIAHVKNIAESRYNIPVTINALTRAFDCPRSRVQAALAHGLDEPGQRGEHAALDQDREQQILDWIRQNAEQSTSVTKTEIMDHCTAEFEIKFTRRWVNSFILRHLDDVIQRNSAPQEEQRLPVPRAFLQRTVKDLHDHVQGCVADLVFNLDEVCIPD
jgi:hypothetical protein